MDKVFLRCREKRRDPKVTPFQVHCLTGNYSSISVTTPEPTVRPPSRIAKRRPFSIAMGVISSTLHNNVVAGHAHLNAFGQGDDAGNVGGTEVELRTIVVEEGSMTAAFFLGQDVNLTLELGVGMDGAGLAQNLASFDVRSCRYHAAERRCCRRLQRSPAACGTSRCR